MTFKVFVVENPKGKFYLEIEKTHRNPWWLLWTKSTSCERPYGITSGSIFDTYIEATLAAKDLLRRLESERYYVKNEVKLDE